MTLHPLRKNGEESSPKHREASGQEYQIIEEEAGFARDQGFKLVFRVQMIAVFHIEEQADAQADDQHADEPCADTGLRKSMYRGHHAAAGEESAQDRKQERDENQPDVPGLHHAAFFLHHHRVQESGAAQPWQQRSIFYRVPAPVTAPAEN